jgi:hypothetical protein
VFIFAIATKLTYHIFQHICVQGSQTVRHESRDTTDEVLVMKWWFMTSQSPDSCSAHCLSSLRWPSCRFSREWKNSYLPQTRSCAKNLGFIWSRDSAVGTAADYGLEGREVGGRVLVGARFSPLHVVQTGSGAHSASYTKGIGAISTVVKRPERKVDHSPPTSAEIKNMWIYTCTSLYVSMA